MSKLKTPAVIAALLLGGAVAAVATAQSGPGDGQGRMGKGDMGEMGDMGPGQMERGQGMLMMFDAIDADQDGMITMAEVEAHHSAEFAAADTNGDGMLSPDELAARAMARFQETLDDRVARMIDNLDNDGDGALSADEVGRGPFANRFARIDTDNDGAISKEEAEAMLQHRKMRGMRGRGMQDE